MSNEKFTKDPWQMCINEHERIVYEKQNGRTGTEYSGKRSNSVTETDGFRKVGVPNTKSNSQVEKEK